MKKNHDITTIDVRVHRTSERAALVSTSGDFNDAVWVPLSQVELMPFGKGDRSTMDIPQWLAEEKGLV